MLDVAVPFLGGCVSVVTAKPLSQGNPSGICITRLDIWILGTSSLSHHQPDRMSAISKCLQALALEVLSSHLLLGSESQVELELENVPICSSRRGLCVPSPLFIFQPRFPLPLLLLLLIILLLPPTGISVPHGGHLCAGILVNIKKILSSWKSWQSTSLFLSFWCETQSQAPRGSRAILTAEG